jgi:PTH1 family peptidyl-tRNA hydrolase
MSTQCVILGLGNPGKQYQNTRHNLGYLVLQKFAENLKFQMKEEKQFQAIVARGRLDGVTVHLLLPLTYMNESGRALRAYLEYYKLTSRDVIVVCDDIALPYGEMRLRQAGSSGGHNGLKSIQKHLVTQEYVRLRMGIGEKERMGELADYVLQPFSLEEMQTLPLYIDKGVDVLKHLVIEGISKSMNVINISK